MYPSNTQPGYIGNHPPISPAVPPAPITQNLEVLEKSVAALRETVHELCDRLGPVLNSDGPVAGCEEVKGHSMTSPLADRITDISEAVRDINATVSRVCHRLAL